MRIPCRRAMSDKLAPATWLCATISRFCAGVHERRLCRFFSKTSADPSFCSIAVPDHGENAAREDHPTGKSESRCPDRTLTSIDDLIDAHLWLRRREARMNRRPLTLDSVPDELRGTNGLPRLNLEIVLRSLDLLWIRTG